MSGRLPFDPRGFAQQWGSYLTPELAQQLVSQGGAYASPLLGPGVAGTIDPTQAAPFSAGPPAPGTPYTGPKPYVAGAYNTLAPSDFAAYQASLQAPGAAATTTTTQPLPGLLDPSVTSGMVDTKKLFDPDRMRGAWSGGEGSGGNGGGQR